MPKYFKDQGGALPILILLAAVGIIGFLLISNTFNFRDNLFSQLFPKPSSYAAKPSPSLGMNLISETIRDSAHDRTWVGSLGPSQSFQVSLPFCTYEEFVTGPGGAGFMMHSFGKGSFNLTATSPTGVVTKGHFKIPKPGQQDYRGCFVQPYFNAVTQIGTGTIEPGTWTVTFINTGTRTASNLELRIYIEQAVSGWQEAHCPQEDWNFD